MPKSSPNQMNGVRYGLLPALALINVALAAAPFIAWSKFEALVRGPFGWAMQSNLASPTDILMYPGAMLWVLPLVMAIYLWAGRLMRRPTRPLLIGLASLAYPLSVAAWYFP